METSRHLPESSRLSIVIALVLLAYAITPFVRPPSQDLAVQLPGFFVDLDFQFSGIISIICAGLAATGIDWLVRAHPNRMNQPTLPHVILPALTAWAIGLPLSTMPVSTAWWALFGLGSFLLILVLIAEYVIVDPSDVFHPTATMMLTAVSLALFLVMAVALRSTGQRLYLTLPGITLGAGLVALRTLYLRHDNRWLWLPAAAIGVLIGQLSIGLHYLPVPPLSFGLILLGCLYALITLIGRIDDPQSGWRLWVEPMLVMVVFLLLAIIFFQ
jgi:hypothetical protein